MRSVLPTVLALVSLSGAVPFWRMECPGSTYARLDPIVDPGVISSHMHTIHGGSNFGMTVTTDDLLKSSCTSCRITEDKSIYWTPTMYFVHNSGDIELVPQDGGMIVYYLNRGNNVTAFPKDFRMLAGDTRLRNYDGPFPDKATSFWTASDRAQSSLQQKALGFNCLHYGQGTDEPTLYRHFMPPKSFLDSQCRDGLRLEMVFPSCWNGKDLDSPNHKDHVAYPTFVQSGDCPSDFPIRLPTLLYETKWTTGAFANKKGQFVLSNGDPTGNGYHADFVTGWEPSFLQKAINTCTTTTSGVLEDCPVFTLQNFHKASQCHFELPKELQHEDAEKPGKALPGNVPIQNGPQYASKVGGGGAPVVSSKIPVQSSSSAHATTTPLAQAPSTTSKPAAPPVESSTKTKIARPSVNPVNLAEVSVVTPAPSPTSASDTRKYVHTTYTSNGAVYEVAIEQVEVTVTATETVFVDAPHKKRHVHAHAYHPRHAHHHHQ